MSWPVLFETERLFARRLSSADAAEMVRIFGDPEAMKYVGGGNTLTETDCVFWIDDVTARNFEVRGYGLIGLFEKGTESMIACSGVFHPGQQVEPEISYWLERNRWGQGFATELVRGLIEYARSKWGVGRMTATIFPENVASRRVLEKCGFRWERNKTGDEGEVIEVWELVHK